MVPADRAVVTSYRLSIVTMPPSAIIGHISETVRDSAKVTISHL